MFGTDVNEVLVERAKPLRNNPGPNEAFCFPFQIDLPELVARVRPKKFLCGPPDTVIRAKGIVRLVDSSDEYFVFQKVDRFENVQLFPVRKSVRRVIR